jgi:cob(I)alamin adenosyltransferase
MRIYTRTGDRGETGLWGGGRVPKNHLLVEVCGEVDELNAAVGLARSQHPGPALDAVLERIQHRLFGLGADLAAAGGSKSVPRIVAEQIAELEAEIDRCEEQLEPLRQFILPGGSPLASHLHLARAVCRRAERAVVAAGQLTMVPAEALAYLNRLSDLLFVLARRANAEAGVPDVTWNS